MTDQQLLSRYATQMHRIESTVASIHGILEEGEAEYCYQLESQLIKRGLSSAIEPYRLGEHSS